MRIVVAGGGIAGLAAAVGLGRKGLDVQVLEQKPELSEEGAGIQLGPNAAKALMALGVWERLEPHLTPLKSIEVGDGVGGRGLCRIALDKAFEARFGAPYSVIHRSDLLSELAAAAKDCPSVEVATGAQVVSVARFEWPVARLMNGTEIEADALIGADGFRSVVRSSLFGEEEPRQWGERVHRTVLGTEGVPAIPTDAVCLWLLPGGHVVYYPLRGGRLLNVVIVGRGTAGTEAPNISRGYEDLTALVAAARNWRAWAAIDRDPSARWGAGQVSLIGDAAHPSLPYLAQGAAMALEDAVVLASRVGSPGDLEAALRAYEAARRPRTATITREARRQGWIDHLGMPLSLARDALLRALPQAALFRRLDWIYGWKPEAEQS